MLEMFIDVISVGLDIKPVDVLQVPVDELKVLHMVQLVHKVIDELG
jgi:hypothetical protein